MSYIGINSELTICVRLVHQQFVTAAYSKLADYREQADTRTADEDGACDDRRIKYVRIFMNSRVAT